MGDQFETRRSHNPATCNCNKCSARRADARDPKPPAREKVGLGKVQLSPRRLLLLIRHAIELDNGPAALGLIDDVLSQLPGDDDAQAAPAAPAAVAASAGEPQT